MKITNLTVNPHAYANKAQGICYLGSIIFANLCLHFITMYMHTPSILNFFQLIHEKLSPFGILFGPAPIFVQTRISLS